MFGHASALYMAGHYPLLFSLSSVQVSCTARFTVCYIIARSLTLRTFLAPFVVPYAKSAEMLLPSVYI
jgi:hypothetical protein